MNPMKSSAPLVKMIQTVFFDLDGTLIDTEPAAAQAASQCCKEWGVEIEIEDASFVTGRTWKVAFDYLFGKYPIPVSREQAVQQVMSRYRAALKKNLVIVPGGAEAIRAIAPHCKLGLLSGSGRAEVLWALDELGVRDFFSVILGAEDYPQSKPAPDGYLKALELLHADSATTLVFEDSTAGIASARAAGLWVVAITGTNHFKQDLSQAHASIPDLRGVDWQWVQEFF